MANTVVGLFDTFDEAQSVVNDLQSHGFDRNDISLIANDTSGEHARAYGSADDKMDNTGAEKAGSGAVAGTATGAGLGLLIGLGALAIPGVGPILAAGPLAAALGAGVATVAGSAAIGAGLGAASGALVGPLVDAGIPRPEAELYSEGVRRGGTLVTVQAEDAAMAQQAHDIMSRYNVVDIDRRGEMYTGGGWNYDQNAQPYSSDQISTFRNAYTTSQPMTATDTNHEVTDRSETIRNTMGRQDEERAVGAAGFDSFDADFRKHYQANYSNSGLDYNAYGPVYRYGYNMANDSRYSSSDWSMVESEARTRWEERNPNTWDQFKDGVRYAWDRAHSRI